MDDDIASLNYDCNYNLYLAKRLVIDMKKVRDRQNAVKWLRFLMNNTSNDIVEIKLRNDFMHYLVLNLQEGQLGSPFDKPPPIVASLMEIADFIVSKFVFFFYYNFLSSKSSSISLLYYFTSHCITPNDKIDDVIDDGLDSTNDLEDPDKEKSMIASLSPDNGEFLASQPVPHHGSFCYLAITSKKKDN
ncbi:PREDICTED: uncharacterized protein LOC107067905 [Polistes dominula]|uniref:Uncharacterized protein LOC107067905 n=1 Tax=Polistes dominula TaxID=743375 RepID=A0ABM1IGH8_POLDO|nr:PREDICTED: uncharacterized protein LOC107067905 [Polistes dominula]